tara:strand:- start:52915 stop:54834 length:1920 start_codon:yes stop_codon:yes gene_type:complete
MILNKVKINGYKRLKEVNTDVDSKLLAIIGPNEAGKSSFFEALLSIENQTPYKVQELTKGIAKDDLDVIVQVEYLLDSDELNYLNEIYHIGNPRYFIVEKIKSGKLNYRFSDEIIRDTSFSNNILVLLNKFNSNKTYKNFSQNNFIEDESFLEIFDELKEDISNDNQNVSKYFQDYVEKLKNCENKSLVYKNNRILILFDKLVLKLQEFILDRNEDHPKETFLNYCITNRPPFVFFDNENRFLKGSYNIAELQQKNNKSIENLFSVGKIKVADYINSINTRNEGEKAKLNDIVNRNLRNVFINSWSQTKIFPRMTLDVNSVKLQVISGDEDNYTEIVERSDGLKQYISLRAFLALKSIKTKPILLIDEAELHLHYSAQADLVTEFEKQNIVNSIIYSTHSAGCLPSDLGCSIRAIEQIKKDGIDTGLSKIRNSIWTNNGGLSPILFAMGANIIAFTLARKAIIAEGPSETILLPKMFLEVIDEDYLGFQIAPGIASISPNQVSLFELEASKVGYIVDGDSSGHKLKNKLKNNGVDETKITMLEEGCSLEDYIDSKLLIKAVNRELIKSKLEELVIDKLPEKNRIKFIEKACKKKGFDLPSKTKIAKNIVYKNNSKEIIDKTKKQFIKKTYLELIDILEL